MSSGVVCQKPGRAKSSSNVLVLPKPRHKISPRCQCIGCKRLIQGYFQASEAVRRQGAYVCLTAARCFNSSGRTKTKPQHLNQKEKPTLLLKSLLLQLPLHLRDSHPAYECCGCICKREKVQRFARLISSKICAPRCASICGVSAHVFVYK